MLTIKQEKMNAHSILHLNGVIDADTVAQILKEVRALIETKTLSVVLNCAFVHEIDATALAVLLDLQYKLAQGDRHLAFLSVPKDLLELIEQAGVRQYVKVYDHQEELKD